MKFDNYADLTADIQYIIAKSANDAKAKFDNEIDDALSMLLDAGVAKEDIEIFHFIGAPDPTTEIHVSGKCKYMFVMVVDADTVRIHC